MQGLWLSSVCFRNSNYKTVEGVLSIDMYRFKIVVSDFTYGKFEQNS